MAKTKPLSVSLLEASYKLPYAPHVPPHLATSSWLNFESRCANSFAKILEYELKRLAKEPNVKSVHDSRVGLRRWIALWSVLENDGWGCKKYSRKFAKPLRKLLKSLGELRDLDVNIKIGQEVAVTQAVIETWQKSRDILKNKVAKKVKRLKLKSLTKDLTRYLKQQPDKIIKDYKDKRQLLLKVSAYDHLSSCLSDQERLVKALDAQANTPDELHQVRLSIKHWRYLLAEFFGLTNLQLYAAQQHLGRLHDYNRIILLLAGDATNKASSRMLSRRYRESLNQYRKIRKHLCYGLRPEVKSFPQKVEPLI